MQKLNFNNPTPSTLILLEFKMTGIISEVLYIFERFLW